MLLLDTTGLPAGERVDGFRAAMGEASVPCRIEHLASPEDLRARMHLWTYGQTNLFTADGTGFRLFRTPRHVRMESPAMVALAVQPHGLGRFSQFGSDQLVGGDDLMLTDLTAPYEFAWSGTGGSRAFHVPYERLALPADVVRRGAVRLRASPLHDLVRDHLRRLSASAEQLAADPGAASLGSATVELVRALLVSAAGDRRIGRPVLVETLVTRVLAYVGRHVREPDLTPERIAAAHNVSVRQLYKACAEAGVSLEQTVIEQRLELAWTRLATAAGRRQTIAVTARWCGFRDPRHFARRFRAAYGMSPREWQQLPGGR